MQQNLRESYFVPPQVLKVEGLVKIYGKRRVVDGVSFHVNKGEIVGLLGPNGAGKTTSFRMTCGLIEANGGVVYLGDKDVTNWPMYRRSREGGMGYLPQENSVFRNLSVQHNLLGIMEMLGMPYRVRKQRCNELLEKFRLTHLRRSYGSRLSGGERRRLEIARALVSDPKIILLDEPFAAIDPVTVKSIQEIIRQLAREGISILVTDHKERETLEITQRSYVIDSGRVLCHGTPAEVLSNEEACRVYFGEGVKIAAPPLAPSDYSSEPKETVRERKNHIHRESPEQRPAPPLAPPSEPRQPRPQVSAPSSARPFAGRRPATESDPEAMRDYWEETSTPAPGKRLTQTTSHELPSKSARPAVQSKQPHSSLPQQEDTPPTKSGLMRLFGWGK